MLRLGMTTRAETFQRLSEPLAERDIAVEHLQISERTIPLRADSDPFPSIDVGFVYPGRIMEGGVADALLSVPWVNGRRAVLTSRNKAEVYARLSRAGIPMPETTLVSNPTADRDVREAAAEIGFPVVVKPNSTTRGVGVTRVSDPDSLSGVVDYLDLIHEFPATGDRSFLLQAYLPDARDFRAMVVDGDCVGAVERRLPEDVDGWKHNVHQGAEAVEATLPPVARRLAERTAAALDIRYLGVDLLLAGDRWVVNETNARPTVDDADNYDEGFYDRLAELVRTTATE